MKRSEGKALAPCNGTITLFNKVYCVILYMEVIAGNSENASHLCHLKRSDLHMSYAVYGPRLFKQNKIS